MSRKRGQPPSGLRGEGVGVPFVHFVLPPPSPPPLRRWRHPPLDSRVPRACLDPRDNPFSQKAAHAREALRQVDREDSSSPPPGSGRRSGGAQGTAALQCITRFVSFEC